MLTSTHHTPWNTSCTIAANPSDKITERASPPGALFRRVGETHARLPLLKCHESHRRFEQECWKMSPRSASSTLCEFRSIAARTERMSLFKRRNLCRNAAGKTAIETLRCEKLSRRDQGADNLDLGFSPPIEAVSVRNCGGRDASALQVPDFGHSEPRLRPDPQPIIRCSAGGHTSSGTDRPAAQ